MTAAQEQQAKGRILRGDREKVIVNIRYDNPVSKHFSAIRKMKTRLMELLLGSCDRSCAALVRNLMSAAESMMRADVLHAVATQQWKECFRNCIEGLVNKMTRHEGLYSLNTEFLRLKARALAPLDNPQIISVGDMQGVYLSKSKSKKLF